MHRFAFRAALAGALVTGAPARALEPVAAYSVTFDAAWSAATHPTDIPPDPHFSTLVGGSHDAGVRFWQEGGIATPGIEQMAEEGRSSPLAAEVGAAIAAGRAHAVTRGREPFDSPGRAAAVVEMTDAHPLATVVSMVAPSPDWFVGVDSLDLRAGDEWVEELVVELHAYDAGTDSGYTFLSPDADLEPQEPIAELTGFPFANAPPLGTFTFRRLHGDTACWNGLDDDGDGAVDFAGDLGCETPEDGSERGPGRPCDDGLDDDGDGAADFPADLGCRDAAWASERAQCSDGINNDPAQDSAIDFDGGASQNGGVPLAALDPDCTAPWQDREARTRRCGLGFELAPLLVAVAWRARRLARRSAPAAD